MMALSNDKRPFPRVAISLKIQVQENDNRLAAEMLDLTVR